jgi:hypothetical protein
MRVRGAVGLQLGILVRLDSRSCVAVAVVFAAGLDVIEQHDAEKLASIRSDRRINHMLVKAFTTHLSLF